MEGLKLYEEESGQPSFIPPEPNPSKPRRRPVARVDQDGRVWVMTKGRKIEYSPLESPSSL